MHVPNSRIPLHHYCDQCFPLSVAIPRAAFSVQVHQVLHLEELRQLEPVVWDLILEGGRLVVEVGRTKHEQQGSVNSWFPQAGPFCV